MIIKKDNLLIRSATVEDAETLTNWWNDGRIMAHAGFPNGLGQALEETINQIKKNDINLSQRCIIQADNNRIGEMSFTIGENFAEIGIKICEISYQNHGYGKCILRMLIDYLFTDEEINNKVKIEKIILDTNIDNKRAQHVYEKLGFRKVATNVDVWKNQLGEWQTSIDYEMSLEDYRKVCLES
ncbi:MAG: GNAT family protein [Clostridium sp.]|uniref:GNAT family N-acetyltransferase n=1 Tax=Clostridium sp. TaxID=1506 RepID=UPI00302B8C4D